MTEVMLDRLRRISMPDRVQPGKREDRKLLQEWQATGVRFAASGGRLETAYYTGLEKLLACIVPMNGTDPILQEGGIYLGCWLESTGTINAELLSRLIPSVSETTYLAFADQQREDGLLPYKLTESGPSFRQIQLVTPLARCVWNHYELHGRDISFLKTMYQAMSRYDDWIARFAAPGGPAAWRLSAPLIPGMICRPGSGMFRTRPIGTMLPPPTRTPRYCLSWHRT